VKPATRCLPDIDTSMAHSNLPKGLVQVYTGNGKGKTTAALGLVARAHGQGLKAHVIFFMKGGYPYGERITLEQLSNVSYEVFGHEHFVDPNNVQEVDREEARKALQSAQKALTSGKYDLVILDEVNVATSWGLIKIEDLLKLIDKKPPSVELVLTGRYADERLIAKADLVSEIVEVKHPYQQGIPARKGIEY
jgi:cob(I)alamin adenosyltransferase